MSTDWGIGCRTCAPDDRSGDLLAAVFGVEPEPRNRHERRAAKKRGRRR